MDRKNITNFDETKQRLLQFVELHKIKKGVFFEKCGLSASNFSGKSGQCELSTGKIVQILKIYPDLNPDWLLLGMGEMLRSSARPVGNITNSTAVGVNVTGNGINISNYGQLLSVVDSLSSTVSTLTSTNASLTSANAALTAEVSRLRSIIDEAKND